MKRLHSYGIICLNKEKTHVVIVKNKTGYWGLPKGTPEAEETPLETAQREFVEETGIVNYSINEGESSEEEYVVIREGIEYKKTVTYFSAFAEEMITGEILEDVVEVVWLPLDKARERLVHNATIHALMEVVKS